MMMPKSQEPSKESLTTPPEFEKSSSSVAYRSFEAAERYEDHWEKNVSGISDVERLGALS